MRKLALIVTILLSRLSIVLLYSFPYSSISKQNKLRTSKLMDSSNQPSQVTVDQRCIDCDVCRWMCPKIFSRKGVKSFVVKQPTTPVISILFLHNLTFDRFRHRLKRFKPGLLWYHVQLKR